MKQTFGSTCAHAYDLLYLDEDDNAGYDLIDNIFHPWPFSSPYCANKSARSRQSQR
ncbi:MAG TPA: hypothetical protein VFC02_00710 [Anaerolineales bacterium]|jgi:hypothetical protein|nr:hypothetical protein [Anaerolineales bacterium]